MGIANNLKLANKTILLHYHLFKNAGSSIDKLLIENFGNKWVTREFGSRNNPGLLGREIVEWVTAHNDAIAFSSHTIEFPVPAIEGLKVLPIIFVRHPIDRIVSAYRFESAQGHSGWSSVLARNTSLKGYIEVHLAMPGDRQCRNFHLDRFSRWLPSSAGSELERALQAVHELPFVGVVEDFDESLKVLAELIRIDYPEFAVRSVMENVSRDALTSSLNDRLNKIKDDIGQDLFDRLIELNAEDIHFYDAVAQKNRRHISPE